MSRLLVDAVQWVRYGGVGDGGGGRGGGGGRRRRVDTMQWVR